MKEEYHFMVAVMVEDGKIVPNSAYVDVPTTPMDNVFNPSTYEWKTPNFDIEDEAIEYLNSLLKNGQRESLSALRHEFESMPELTWLLPRDVLVKIKEVSDDD
jgi:hypothetical protein